MTATTLTQAPYTSTPRVCHQLVTHAGCLLGFDSWGGGELNQGKGRGLKYNVTFIPLKK